MRKHLCLPCLLGALAVVTIAVTGTILILRRDSKENPPPADTMQEATSSGTVIEYGQELIVDLNATGADLSTGPCIDDGETFPDWVIDIVHDPREPIDDLPENQCGAFRDGRVDKFIEFTTSGKAIRIYEGT